MSGSSQQRAAIVALGVVAITLGLVVVLGDRHRGPTATPQVRDAGGTGAVHAPIGPSVPGQPDGGVHLIGFVVDGAGLPVAGAEVSAELERGMPDRALNPAPKHATDAGVPVDAGVPIDAGAPAVSTAPPSGADGRFAIGNLVPGRYRVRVTGPGLLAAEVRFVPVPSDAARLVVARQVAIAGTVLDGGKPVANATVGLRGEAIGGTLETHTDQAGKFAFDALPEGRYQLYAWQGALAARTVRVSRLGAGPFGPLELALEAGTIVIGRVIDRDEGVGLAAAIELRPVGDDQAPRYARSEPDGTFRFEGIPTGTWIADAFAPGFTSPGGVELIAGKSIPELALVRGAAVEGRVVDGDGQPIADAVVRALTPGPQPTEISEAVDRDHLRRYSGRTMAPTPVTSFAGDPQLIPRGELGVMVGPIPPLPPPGTEVARTASVVEGTGVGMVGEPAPLAVDPARASIWTTGADGKFRIRGLGKGKFIVIANATGFAAGESKPTQVEPGQLITGVDIVLTPGTFVVGKVTDQHGLAVIGAEVSAMTAGDPTSPTSAFTDAEGLYRLGPFTGKLELRGRAYGHGDAHRTLELAAVKGKVAGEHHEDLVLPVADSELTGILDDATGAPVGSAEIEILGGEGRHAIANADGTFAVDMLPAGPLRIRITHPAYPPLELDAVAGDGKTPMRVRLPLGGAIEGALIDDASASPLASVTLIANGPAGATSEATTDTKGRFVVGPIVPGAWKLVVKQPGYLPLQKALDVPASRAPGATSVHDVLLALKKGALLGGTVRDDRGTRIAGARVTVTLDGATVEAETDTQGEFRLRDVPTGDVDVVGAKGELRGSTHRTVRPGDEVLGLSIELR